MAAERVCVRVRRPRTPREAPLGLMRSEARRRIGCLLHCKKLRLFGIRKRKKAATTARRCATKNV